MGRLDGKAIIITGAGSGLGREMALLFAREGANVSACGRNPDKLESLREEAADMKGQLLTLRADVSFPDDARDLVNQTLGAFGKIDVLINNAAVFENSTIANTTLESWTDQLHNNVSSAFLMSRLVIPQMRKERSGIIINFTSSLAKTGGAGFGAYSASKAALEALTFTLDEEESPHGIHAYIINPGIMRTNMQAMGEDPAQVAKKLLHYLLENRLRAGSVVELDQPEPEFHI